MSTKHKKGETGTTRMRRTRDPPPTSIEGNSEELPEETIKKKSKKDPELMDDTSPPTEAGVSQTPEKATKGAGTTKARPEPPPIVIPDSKDEPTSLPSEVPAPTVVTTRSRSPSPARNPRPVSAKTKPRSLPSIHEGPAQPPPVVIRVVTDQDTTSADTSISSPTGAETNPITPQRRLATAIAGLQTHVMEFAMAAMHDEITFGQGSGNEREAVASAVDMGQGVITCIGTYFSAARMLRASDTDRAAADLHAIRSNLVKLPALAQVMEGPVRNLESSISSFRQATNAIRLPNHLANAKSGMDDDSEWGISNTPFLSPVVPKSVTWANSIVQKRLSGIAGQQQPQPPASLGPSMTQSSRTLPAGLQKSIAPLPAGLQKSIASLSIQHRLAPQMRRLAGQGLPPLKAPPKPVGSGSTGFHGLRASQGSARNSSADADDAEWFGDGGQSSMQHRDVGQFQQTVWKPSPQQQKLHSKTPSYPSSFQTDQRQIMILPEQEEIQPYVPSHSVQDDSTHQPLVEIAPVDDSNPDGSEEQREPVVSADVARERFSKFFGGGGASKGPDPYAFSLPSDDAPYLSGTSKVNGRRAPTSRNNYSDDAVLV